MESWFEFKSEGKPTLYGFGSDDLAERYLGYLNANEDNSYKMTKLSDQSVHIVDMRFADEKYFANYHNSPYHGFGLLEEIERIETEGF